MQKIYVLEVELPSLKTGPMFVEAVEPKRNTEPAGWEPLVTTYIIDDGLSDAISPFVELLAEFFKFGSKFECLVVFGELILKYDTKKWIFHKAYPQSVNFGELSYSNDPTVRIEVTWLFDSCTYESSL